MFQQNTKDWYHTNNALFFFFFKSTLLFIYFSVSLSLWEVQQHKDSVSNGLSKKIALELGMSHDTFHDCELLILFPRLLWVCSVFHWELLCCSLLCTHKYVSCLDRIQFHLEHEHLQLKKKMLCALLVQRPCWEQATTALNHSLPDILLVVEVLFPTGVHRHQCAFKNVLIQYILEINKKERKKFSYV